MVDTKGGAAGWDAIDEALGRLYPEAEPKHYGTLLKWRLGGRDPLDGISVYAREDHWHFVTYGMSELYAKESEVPDVSGWGFEFTLRLAIISDEEPPVWALNFLQNLARYVFSNNNPFAPGHHVDLNGPISLANPDTEIRAITFVDDPELGVIDTPHGRLRFLQIVGLTLPEYAVIEQWDAQRLLHALAPHIPLFVTDLGRASLTDDPTIAAAIAEGVARYGSSTGSVFVQDATWRSEASPGSDTIRTTISVGANASERIARMLSARLPFGRGLLIDGTDAAVGFQPGERLIITDRGDHFVEIHLPPPILAELIAVLRPTAGTYSLPGAPGLVVRIIRSQIRDQDGTVVAEVG